MQRANWNKAVLQSTQQTLAESECYKLKLCRRVHQTLTDGATSKTIIDSTIHSQRGRHRQTLIHSTINAHRGTCYHNIKHSVISEQNGLCEIKLHAYASTCVKRWVNNPFALTRFCKTCAVSSGIWPYMPHIPCQHPKYPIITIAS